MIETDIERFIRSFNKTQQEEETMNTETNTEFKPVPTTPAEVTKFVELDDAEFNNLLAVKDSVTFVTDADETTDEPTPTIH